MIRLLLSFFLDTFKSKSQLQLEILFLRKQLEIALRSSVKGKTKPFDRFFLSRLKDLLISWRDSLIIFNENHLHRVLTRYFHYYNNQRTHLGLKKDAPVPRKVQAVGKIESVPVANGLHHYYYRQAA